MGFKSFSHRPAPMAGDFRRPVPPRCVREVSANASGTSGSRTRAAPPGGTGAALPTGPSSRRRVRFAGSMVSGRGGGTPVGSGPASYTGGQGTAGQAGDG